MSPHRSPGIRGMFKAKHCWRDWIKIPSDKIQLSESHCFQAQSKLKTSSNQREPSALTRSQQGMLPSSAHLLIPGNEFCCRTWKRLSVD